MEAADDEATRYEASAQRAIRAPEERGRRAVPGEQLAGVPEVTRALATHYTSLAGLMTLKTNQHTTELGALLLELRTANQLMAGVAESVASVSSSLALITERTLASRRREEHWWRDPAYVTAGTMCIMAGCIIGALLAR